MFRRLIDTAISTAPRFRRLVPRDSPHDFADNSGRKMKRGRRAIVGEAKVPRRGKKSKSVEGEEDANARGLRRFLAFGNQ